MHAPSSPSGGGGRPYKPFEPIPPQISRCCWTEARARQVILVIGMLAMAGYTGYQVWKAIDAANNPVTKFNTIPVSRIESPGIIVCAPDTMQAVNGGWFLVNGTYCVVNNRGSIHENCPGFNVVNYTFANLLPGARQCLDLSPGAIISNKQTIISIEWVYIIPDFNIFEEGADYGLYRWDAAFYGFYTNSVDRATADVTQGSIVGSTLITFTRKTTSDVGKKNVEHTVDIDSVSTAIGSRPMAGGSNIEIFGFANNTLPDGRTARWSAGSLILLPHEMAVRTQEEVVAWGPLDVFSAIGGFYAIVASFLVAFHGEAYFRNPGLLRKIFYGVPVEESAPTTELVEYNDGALPQGGTSKSPLHGNNKPNSTSSAPVLAVVDASTGETTTDPNQMFKFIK